MDIEYPKPVTAPGSMDSLETGRVNNVPTETAILHQSVVILLESELAQEQEHHSFGMKQARTSLILHTLTLHKQFCQGCGSTLCQFELLSEIEKQTSGIGSTRIFRYSSLPYPKANSLNAIHKFERSTYFDQIGDQNGIYLPNVANTNSENLEYCLGSKFNP